MQCLLPLTATKILCWQPARGGLDPGHDRWEIGGTAGANTYIEAAFTAKVQGSRLTPLFQVGTSTTPHSILVEAPVTVAAGQTQTYRIQLLIDNI